MDDQQREPGRRRRPPTQAIEPTLPLDMPRAGKPDAATAAARRAKRVVAEPAADLFGGHDRGVDARPASPASQPIPDQVPGPTPGARMTDPVPGQASKPDSGPAIPAAAAPCPPAERTAAPVPALPPPHPDGASVLAPNEVLLQRVDPRSFRPNERADAWLYWLTDRGQAEDAMRHGLPIEPDAPVLLADRPSMLLRLAALLEDPEFSPNAIAVLRLRRVAVAPFLRPGPEPASYVLCGEAPISA